MGISKEKKCIYIVDGARTPFLKARAKRGPFSAADLAVAAGREVLARQPFSPDAIDEVIIGCMNPSEDEANIGRIISMRLGCGKETPAWTVQRNCASGMQSIDSAMKDIALGRHDLVLAGGTEAMSRSPLIFQPDMANWFGRLNSCKTFPAKLSTLCKFRPRYLKPIIALMRGLTDPLCGYNMGQTAEQVAYQFGITREDMDKFAVQSHQALAKAQDQKSLNSIAPLYASTGKYFDADDGLRRDSSVAKLAKLRPTFDRKYGMVTAGNSSQITDGACVLLLASEDAVKRYKLEVLGKIVDFEWAALDPKVMGLGPAVAVPPMLLRQGMKLDQVDYWELNEAFAAQVIGCVRAWEDEKFCHENLGLDEAFGSLDLSRLNVDGGAIALGHPVGATGARLVLQLLHTLKRENAQTGVATLCIGGGQGGAILLERV
jgi:acetyl-CoA C-acetyltransferase